MKYAAAIGIVLSVVVLATSIGTTAFAQGQGRSHGPDAQWQGQGSDDQQYGQRDDPNAQDWRQSDGRNYAGDRGYSTDCWSARQGDGNHQRGSWRGRQSNRMYGYDARRGSTAGCYGYGSNQYADYRQADQGCGAGQRSNGAGWSGDRRHAGGWSNSRRGHGGSSRCGNGYANYGR